MFLYGVFVNSIVTQDLRYALTHSFDNALYYRASFIIISFIRHHIPSFIKIILFFFQNCCYYIINIILLFFESLVMYIYIYCVLWKWVCQKPKKGKAAYFKKIPVIGFQKKKNGDHVSQWMNLSPTDNSTFCLPRLLYPYESSM